jgi:superkiller protein 3
VLRPNEPQAWQGLVKIFEKQGTKKLGPYQDAVVNLARIFHDAEDMYKCQDVVDKFIDYVRDHGDKLQYADALWIQLPEGPLYSFLEGRFPHPAQTYERIAGILEDFEKKRINTLIGERRTKLGAKLSEVTLEAKREVYAQSKLEHIYHQVINWVSDDDIRRQYEEKLVQYCYDRFLVLPPGEHKDQEREKVHGLAKDMVVINHPYKLAWDISIDWQDKKETRDYDVNMLRSYCLAFPDSDLYKIITAFLTSTLSPFSMPEQDTKPDAALTKSSSDESEDDDDGGVPTYAVPLTDEDRLVMLVEGVTALDSTFGYRLAGELFVHLGEYESTVDFMRKAQEHLVTVRELTSMELRNTEDSYLVSLGTALVYFQSPRHHAEAKVLFDKVLEHDVTSTPALLGVGLIFEEEEEYDQAVDFLGRALERDRTNIRVRSEAAWVKALRGDWEVARAELQECIELLDKKDPPKDLLAETQYRVGVCIWNLDPSKQARKQRKGESAYAYWLLALNNNMNHAPSYTSLGLFYSDYAKDKKRSRRCFQKALELSSSEVIAAERLARSFADDGDWDRVELVAQRIVDSGKVKPPPGSKRKGLSWPFAALGVAELNKQDYHKAIVSFQSALRLSPDDYHSWVGLGESYHSSGRFVAATKAILNAQKLEEDSKTDISSDTWFTKYMLANIKRELGDFDEAINLYQSVIETHAEEEGVILALMQTTVENALSCVEKGHYGKSVQLAVDTIAFAAKTTGSVLDTFNFWKSLGDACSVFASPPGWSIRANSMASSAPASYSKAVSRPNTGRASSSSTTRTFPPTNPATTSPTSVRVTTSS